MNKSGLLNPKIAQLITAAGHTETIVVADAGLPIPEAIPNRIDLALKEGIPGFLETLDTIIAEFQVETVILAEEIKTASPEMHQAILRRFPELPIEYIAHEEFKKQTQNAKGIIRTGEFTPYANVILVAGVIF